MDCTTNGGNYARLGTIRLRKGGDLAATTDDRESEIETTDTIRPDSQLFLTLEKNCILCAPWCFFADKVNLSD